MLALAKFYPMTSCKHDFSIHNTQKYTNTQNFKAFIRHCMHKKSTYKSVHFFFI